MYLVKLILLFSVFASAQDSFEEFDLLEVKIQADTIQELTPRCKKLLELAIANSSKIISLAATYKFSDEYIKEEKQDEEILRESNEYDKKIIEIWRRRSSYHSKIENVIEEDNIYSASCKVILKQSK